MGNSYLAGGVVVVGDYFLAYILIPSKLFPQKFYRVMNLEDKELILSLCNEVGF